MWAFSVYSGESLLSFSPLVISDSLQPHGLQHARLPCLSPSPEACSNACALSWWCHSTISSSVIPFSSCLQTFPVTGSFPVSWLFTSGGLNIEASASVLPMSIQNWFPLGLTGLVSLQSKGLSRVFSNTTVQMHQFFFALSLLYGPTLTSIHGYCKNHNFDYMDLYRERLTEIKLITWESSYKIKEIKVLIGI